MWILPILFMIILLVILKTTNKIDFSYMIGGIICCIIISIIMIGFDLYIQTIDTETWSGHVVNVKHKEEWDEWIPPKTKVETYTDSKGKTQTRTVTTPGKWKHHNATNIITTSDSGTISVFESPDGKKFSDKWPNTTEELLEFWPIGAPSASVHTYTNYVQASNSLYKHKDINVKDYSDLPNYPSKVEKYINIDRIVGDVPNKEESLKKLAELNSELNKLIDDPDNPGKKRSWKQVNVIFVNVGDKPKEYGFALQEKWENGNKNDFIISLSLKEDGTVNWVYPFSWTEIELLKIQIRDYIMNLEKIEDFVPVIDEVGKQVAELFVRKQMADYEYLQINPSNTAIVIIWIINVLFVILLPMAYKYDNNNNNNNYHYGNKL